jgi:Protein of unknown function (DUF1569)
MDSRLEKLRNALSVATAGMDRDALTWHPPGKWCAAEILEHLYLTYTGTIKGFERVIVAGKPLATEPSIRNRLGVLVSLGIGFIPEGRTAPKSAEPRGLPHERVRAEIETKIAAMDEIIVKCEGQFGAGIRILDHPILGGLTGAQWRKFHLVHGLHHVKQIRRLQEAMKTISKN